MLCMFGDSGDSIRCMLAGKTAFRRLRCIYPDQLHGGVMNCTGAL